MPVRGPHWTLLGIAPTADVREIKRAYARLLKQTRPDDDPEGFQRLREALEAALAQTPWVKVKPEPVAESEPAEQQVFSMPAVAVQSGLVSVELPLTEPMAAPPPPVDPWASLKPALLQANHRGRAADAIALLDEALPTATDESRRALGDWLLAFCASNHQVQPLFLRAAAQRFRWLDETPSPGERQRALTQLAWRLAQFDAQESLAPLVDALGKDRPDAARVALERALANPGLQALDCREHFECLLMRYLARADDWAPAFIETVFRVCRWEQEHQHLQQFDARAWHALLLRREGEGWYAGLMAAQQRPVGKPALARKAMVDSLSWPPQGWRMRWHTLNQPRQLQSRQLVELMDRRYGWLAQRFPATSLDWLRQPHAHLGRLPQVYLIAIGLFVCLLLGNLNALLPEPLNEWLVFAGGLLAGGGLCAALIYRLPLQAALPERLLNGIFVGILLCTVPLLARMAVVGGNESPWAVLWMLFWVLGVPVLGIMTLKTAFTWLRQGSVGLLYRLEQLDARLTARCRPFLPARAASYRVLVHGLLCLLLSYPAGYVLVLPLYSGGPTVRASWWLIVLTGFVAMQVYFLVGSMARGSWFGRLPRSSRWILAGVLWVVVYCTVLVSMAPEQPQLNSAGPLLQR